MSSLKTTIVLKIDPVKPDAGAMLFAARALREGALVAFPTETVYGLGANLLDKKAIANLYKVKKRPQGKPFTVHIASIKTIKEMKCGITKDARRLIKKFWPGPLTMVLMSESGKKIGFRMPDHKAALGLIKLSGVPVAAPSANLSGRPAPKSAGAVLKDLKGKVDILLDGGQTAVGVESTVVDLTRKPPAILREGAIKKKEIERVVSCG